MTGGRPLGALQSGDPDQIGPYRIRARVGAGETGVVYLADATDGTPVAVKVIHSAVANDPGFGDRFRSQVTAARQVHSPVTVAVLDADPDSDPPWIAFEYVEGPNLHDVVEAGVPGPSAAIAILTGIAEALVAIHQVGIVHQDLKPSNILCPPDGVKVVDFAIAAPGDSSWLAPEQISGQPLTPAVDVFAWGCVAVYTLTGRLAFGGADISPTTRIYRVVYAEADLRGVPADLVAPVSAALAKRPEDRPGVGDLLRLLSPGRVLADAGPPSLQPPGSGPLVPAGPPPPSPPAPAPAPFLPPPSSPPISAPFGWPGAPPPGGPPPGWGTPPPSSPGPPPKKKRRLLLSVGAGAVLLVLIVMLALISGSPKNQPVSAPSTVATTAPASTTPPTITPAGITPAGITPLAQLLPSDVDASADCAPNTTPPSLIGLTDALICSPKQLPGGQIFAFQFDSAADYTSSLVVLNKFKGFDTTTAGSTCPPANDSEDATGWHNTTFPAQDGQILECLSVGTNDNQPDYIWTYPTENAVIDAQGAANSSFTDLDTWWTKDAPPP